MSAFIEFVRDAGIVGWFILVAGIFAVGLAVERAHALYYKYGMNIEAFMAKIQNLVMSGKTDDALVLCSQMEDKPIAKAFKTILEKSDRDDEAIYQAHDIALSETIPQFTKRLGFLAMFANVATLMGLLGTIHGLIISFQAVSNADPSQKQALLAEGISISMYTTAMGLSVAIPLMIIFAILNARQAMLVEQLTEKSSRLVEALTGAHDPLAATPVASSHLESQFIKETQSLRNGTDGIKSA